MKFKYGDYVEVINDPFFNGTRGRVYNYYESKIDPPWTSFDVQLADGSKHTFSVDKLQYVDFRHSSGFSYTVPNTAITYTPYSGSITIDPSNPSQTITITNGSGIQDKDLK